MMPQSSNMLNCSHFYVFSPNLKQLPSFGQTLRCVFLLGIDMLVTIGYRADFDVADCVVVPLAFIFK